VSKPKVAVLRVAPDTVLDEVERLVDLAGVSTALARGATTILKDNISWHFPFPAANTTPWQLEGTIRALARRGFADQGRGHEVGAAPAEGADARARSDLS